MEVILVILNIFLKVGTFPNLAILQKVPEPILSGAESLNKVKDRVNKFRGVADRYSFFILL